MTNDTIKNTETCIFSGDKTDSKEHIFPKWLQHRFSLWTQKLSLPNGTQLEYRQATAPASKTHNGIFSRIENNISRGVYNPTEIYLWAFKIHVGMLQKHVTLKYDRSTQNPDTILPFRFYSRSVSIFRQMYQVWSAGGAFNPNPPGSVLIIPSKFPKMDFAMIHSVEAGVIGLNLGDHFILVCLWDQGAAKKSNALKLRDTHFQKNRIPENTAADAYISTYTWACETAYFSFRIQRSMSFLVTEKSFIITGGTGHTRDQNEAEYSRFCRVFGLTLETFNINIGHRYTFFDRPDFTKLQTDQLDVLKNTCIIPKT